MILSAEYSHGQDKMGTTSVMPNSVLHSSRHSLYAGYLMEPTWHHPHPLKQEPEDSSVNNDSGISPSYSDGSVQNTSPQSYHSEARSEDSGHADREREDPQTNATLGVLARPIMDAPESPQHASLGLLTQPILGTSPQHSQRGLSPRISSPNVPSPQQRLSPQQHLGFLPARSSPQQFSPQQSASFSTPTSTSVTAHSPSVASQSLKPDDNSRSPASSTEMEMYYDDPLRGLQMALQRRGMMGPMQPEQPVNGEKPLQCPLCPFSTTIRSAFNNHLMSEHSEQASCHLCDHTAENHTKLREHLRVEHDLQLGPDEELGSWGEDDESGVTTPKVNSQGKVKTYRCKQCEFSTVTKLEFWEHTRGHIKPERLLTCPKCPFVTEYKHHLEYHLRNHFGSKPFKCDKCSYSCVNKSMLNSHLKSHSNVYQFRCADCAYATKYCHSLKLHLRKYNHNPAMVLNPDGSPNPLPIVDVYGTRRGPKRPKKPEDLNAQQSLPTLHPMFSNPYGFLPSQAIPYPYNTIMNTFHHNPLLSFSNNNPVMQEKPAPPKSEPENTFFNATINTIQQSAMNNNQEGVKEYLTRVITTRQELIARTETQAEEESAKACPGAPLDLSRPEPEQPEQPLESSGDQASGEPSTTTKNRRKGKAFKLERIPHCLQQQSSDEEEGELSPKRLKFDMSPEVAQEKADEPVAEKPCAVEEKTSSCSVNFCEPINGEFRSTISEERKERWKNVKEVYDCAYCDMLFGDVVMYTMHMGYHGYQNPYTCNMCGHQTSDRVQFFLHLFRFAHG